MWMHILSDWHSRSLFIHFNLKFLFLSHTYITSSLQDNSFKLYPTPANDSGHLFNNTTLTFRVLHLQWAIFSDLQLPLVWSWRRPHRSQVKYFLDPRFCSLWESQVTRWIGSEGLHPRVASSNLFWRQDCFSCQSWARTQKAHQRDLRT